MLKVTSGMAVGSEVSQTLEEQEVTRRDIQELRGPSIKEEQVPPHTEVVVEADGTAVVEADTTKAQVEAVQVM